MKVPFIEVSAPPPTWCPERRRRPGAVIPTGRDGPGGQRPSGRTPLSAAAHTAFCIGDLPWGSDGEAATTQDVTTGKLFKIVPDAPTRNDLHASVDDATRCDPRASPRHLSPRLRPPRDDPARTRGRCRLRGPPALAPYPTPSRRRPTPPATPPAASAPSPRGRSAPPPRPPRAPPRPTHRGARRSAAGTPTRRAA